MKRHMGRGLIAIGCLVGLALGTPAESQEILTLQQAIGISLENNYSILAAQEAIEGAEHLKKSAYADFLPKLRAQGSVTHFGETPTTRVPATPAIPVYMNPRNPWISAPPIIGPDPQQPIGFIPATPSFTRAFADQDQFGVQGSAVQPVFTGGALLNRYRQTKIGVESAQTNLRIVQQDLSLSVVQVYFLVLNTIQQNKVADKSVQLLESQRDVSQEFFNVGMIPKNDLLRTEVQLAQRVREQTNATNAIEAAKAQLNLVLQRDIREPVELEDILSYEPVTFDLDASIREALEQRLEIKAAGLRVASDERTADIVASAFYPQVQVSLNAFKSEGSSFNTNMNQGWSAVASGSWTFWEWGKTREDVAAARSQVRRDEYAMAQLKDQISVEVKNAYLVLNAAEKNIITARKAVEQAGEAFRMNQERYREQVGTITEVLDAETQLAQSESDYYTSLSAYNVAKAALYRAMGRTVYEASTPSSPSTKSP
jgi:outer membrane protein